MDLGTFLFAMPLISHADDGDHARKHDDAFDTNHHYYVDKTGIKFTLLTKVTAVIGILGAINASS